MPDNTHAYAAFRACGCICAAVVDNPEHKKDVAREIARWVRAGLRVERVAMEAVRAANWACPHGTERKK